LGLIISTVYLLNFTMGIWELPDNLPVVGNLDEFGAAVLFIASMKHFGYDMTNFLQRRKPPKNSESGEP
ncbi:MAG TPA: hypothetical protein VJ911_10185, partial [Cryomorphaceae bacterium]|nr:hypothetical protein [Cryomorphaceae bacterium]